MHIGPEPDKFKLFQEDSTNFNYLININANKQEVPEYENRNTYHRNVSHSDADCNVPYIVPYFLNHPFF